jgi:putative hemolysin
MRAGQPEGLTNAPSSAIGCGMLLEPLIILALVLFNGVLAGAEIAVVSLRKTRLQELVDGGSGAARAVQHLREKPERFLATVQIGITVVGATAGAFGGSSFAAHLVPLFRAIGPLAPYAQQLALGVVVALISFFSLVLGELVPKSLALRSAEPYALLISRPLLGLSNLTRPLVWLLTASSNLVLKLFGDRTNFIESRLSTEELQQMVTEAAKAGTVHPQAGEIAARALDFSELTVSEVMVPRRQVVSLSLDTSPEELRRTLLEHTHSRMPVWRDSIDNVIGYLSIKDVLALAWEQQLIVLHDLIRPPFFVPSNKRAVELLHEMRTQRVPMAIVVDEQGGLEGIVALEDLLEELVGEIFNEHEQKAPEIFKREADGSVVVLGGVAIRDINRELGLELSEGEWSTVAGLCLALASRIPASGEQFTTDDGVVLEIIDASPRRVRSVRIRTPDRVATPPASDTASAD